MSLLGREALSPLGQAVDLTFREGLELVVAAGEELLTPPIVEPLRKTMSSSQARATRAQTTPVARSSM